MISKLNFELKINLNQLGTDNHNKENNNNLQLSPSANNLHLHVHNQHLSGASLTNNSTDNNSNSASYSSTIDLHHKVNLDNLNNNFLPKEPSSRQNPGMLQNLFQNLRQKSKCCFLMNFKQANSAFMRKVPAGAEADNILGKQSGNLFLLLYKIIMMN